ncbi:MAG: hypothetical protein CSA26_05770 [Desulfobacterales bacterium]|nr:MAG: hypothetical protein CSA26_05770 [Desulfobacterales bacterium]
MTVTDLSGNSWESAVLDANPGSEKHVIDGFLGVFLLDGIQSISINEIISLDGTDNSPFLLDHMQIYSITQVPEPMTAWLFSLDLSGFAGFRKRRNKQEKHIVVIFVSCRSCMVSFCYLIEEARSLRSSDFIQQGCPILLLLYYRNSVCCSCFLLEEFSDEDPYSGSFLIRLVWFMGYECPTVYGSIISEGTILLTLFLSSILLG